MSLQKNFIIFFITFSSLGSWAEPVVLENKKNIKSFEKEKKYQKDHLEIGLFQEFYVNSEFQDQEDKFHTLSGQSFFKKNSDSFQLYSNIGFMFSPQETSESYINSPEFYWGRPIKEGWLYLGRKKQMVSYLEEEWSLGLWNSYLRRDYMNPIAQGRLGLHLEKRIKSFRFWGLVSPLSLPHQSPKWNVRQGRIQSKNRWFHPPPSDFYFKGVKKPIVYDIEKPSVMEVIENHQEAIGVEYDEKNFFASASYAYKPMSSYHIQVLGDEAKINVTSSHANVVAKIRPQILYHKINTYEMGWRLENQMFWASYSLEYPEGVKETVLKQDPIFNKQIYGLGYSIKNIYFLNFEHRFSFSYFNIDSLGDLKSRDRESDELKEVTLDNYQYLFKDAYKLSFVSQRSFKDTKVSLKESYIYSPRLQGGYFQFQMDYAVRASWTWSLGLHIIGSDNKNKKGFFTDFDSNDMFYGGVKYVF